MNKILVCCKKIAAAALILFFINNTQVLAISSYEELQDAIDAVANGGTITLNDAIILTDDITFPTDKNFTIHGVGSGSITTKRYSFNYSPNVAIYDLKINNITTYANKYTDSNGGAINNSLGENFTINNGATFTGNTAGRYGGAIYNSFGSATFTINNGATFTGNTAGSYGGAISNGEYSIFTINNGAKFTGNT
ncbi:MAG: hypothetical protein GX568_09895, partial [Candidatus Gastranaerophilales bacterium]|nr:hypothetical protein [Candidatus Gastranaerophilales bacterium]